MLLHQPPGAPPTTSQPPPGSSLHPPPAPETALVKVKSSSHFDVLLPLTHCLPGPGPLLLLGAPQRRSSPPAPLLCSLVHSPAPTPASMAGRHPPFCLQPGPPLSSRLGGPADLGSLFAGASQASHTQLSHAAPNCPPHPLLPCRSSLLRLPCPSRGEGHNLGDTLNLPLLLTSHKSASTVSSAFNVYQEFTNFSYTPWAPPSSDWNQGSHHRLGAPPPIPQSVLPTAAIRRYP